MYELTLTVGEILSREAFKSAKLVAGANGLNRTVKWSHILETKDFDTLINGEELILTTGVALQLETEAFIKYIARLIDKNTAAICIEIGPHFQKVPDEVLKFADQHHFPIILFEEVVKFVDITQDLHTFIINKHHDVLSQLDTLSRKFISLSLTHNGILKILQELHEHFKENAFFVSNETKPYYYPSKSKDMEQSIRHHINHIFHNESKHHIATIDDNIFALMPVRGLGQTWGHLCLQVNEPFSEEFLFLILDSAALAIAQILLRNRTIEERKQNLENKFIRNLLHKRDYDYEDLQTYLPTASRNMHYRIFLIQNNSLEKMPTDEDWEEIELKKSMIIRSLFKKSGFFPAISIQKNEIAIIASFIADDYVKNDSARFEDIIKRINELDQPPYMTGRHCIFGISKVYKELADAPIGYDESRKVLNLNAKRIVETPFYENLGIYKLLISLEKSNDLENYVADYLSPIFDYDKKTDNKLFETLTAYLECNGSKKETSDRLFIVRQTLYHRLNRLENLLGHDFMEPENRLAIEVAIKAHKLLHPTEF